jgi:hypothetical protein
MAIVIRATTLFWLCLNAVTKIDKIYEVSRGIDFVYIAFMSIARTRVKKFHKGCKAFSLFIKKPVV